MRAVGAIVGVLVLAVACSAPNDYRVVERDAELPREAAVAVDLGVVVDVPLGLPRDVTLGDSPVAELGTDAAPIDEGPVDAADDLGPLADVRDAAPLDAVTDASDDVEVTLADTTSLDAVAADAGAADVRDVVVAWDGNPTTCEGIDSCADCYALVRAGASCGFCGSNDRGTLGHCRVQTASGAPQGGCSGWWFRGTVPPACGRAP